MAFAVPAAAPLITDKNHFDFIKNTLEQIEITTNRDIRAAMIMVLYKYFEIHMDFIATLPRFQKDLINKTYELKKSASNYNSNIYTRMTHSIDRVLFALLPRSHPFDGTEQSDLTDEADVTVTSVASVVTVDTDTSVDTYVAETVSADTEEIIVVPANRLIYSALLEKASSYTPDKHYQIKAYINAAHVVAKYPRSIYQESREAGFHDYKGNYYWKAAGIVPGIGPAIEAFIGDVLRNNAPVA